MPAERCERQSMRRVVGQIEAAFGGQRRVAGILHSRQARAPESVEFGLSGRLGLQLARTDEVVELKDCHRGYRSMECALRR